LRRPARGRDRAGTRAGTLAALESAAVVVRLRCPHGVVAGAVRALLARARTGAPCARRYAIIRDRGQCCLRRHISGISR